MHQNDEPKSWLQMLTPPIVISALFFLIFVIAANNSNVRRENHLALENSPMVEDNSAVNDDTPAPLVTVPRVDRTLLPQEREAWAVDPNSHGFNDDDRAFLDEHGVSESEARAMETILRENGIE